MGPFERAAGRVYAAREGASAGLGHTGGVTDYGKCALKLRRRGRALHFSHLTPLMTSPPTQQQDAGGHAAPSSSSSSSASSPLQEERGRAEALTTFEGRESVVREFETTLTFFLVEKRGVRLCDLVRRVRS